MSNNNLINLNDGKFEIFNYKNLGSVRTTLDEYGNPWFCLNDILNILQIGNVTDVSKRLNPDGFDSIEVIDNLGRPQQMIFVDEGNLYMAIGRSRKPEAQPFMDWVYREVLPMIRRTGMYISDEILFEFMDSPVMFNALIDKYVEARNKLEEVKPKIETYDRIMNSDAAFPMGTAAKIMNFQAPQRKRKSIG